MLSAGGCCCLQRVPSSDNTASSETTAKRGQRTDRRRTAVARTNAERATSRRGAHSLPLPLPLSLSGVTTHRRRRHNHQLGEPSFTKPAEHRADQRLFFTTRKYAASQLPWGGTRSLENGACVAINPGHRSTAEREKKLQRVRRRKKAPLIAPLNTTLRLDATASPIAARGLCCLLITDSARPRRKRGRYVHSLLRASAGQRDGQGGKKTAFA